MNATVQEDGKVSIPQELRDALDLRPGTVLEMQHQAGKLVAWKATSPDPFEKWRGRGRLPASASSEEYLRLIRDGDGR